MHFYRPNGSQPLNLTASTVPMASTALLSGDLTLEGVNINAVNVFQPMGCSPVPTDICLVGPDDDSVNVFDTPSHGPSDSLTHPVNFDETPCDTADPCDWQDNDADGVHALVDTGTMVTCTGQQHITHSHTAHSKIQPCPICSKAALEINKSVIPEGHDGCL